MPQKRYHTNMWYLPFLLPFDTIEAKRIPMALQYKRFLIFFIFLARFSVCRNFIGIIPAALQQQA